MKNNGAINPEFSFARTIFFQALILACDSVKLSITAIYPDLKYIQYIHLKLGCFLHKQLIVDEELLMTIKLTEKQTPIFEQSKRINQYGQEYWTAREFSQILGYDNYRRFLAVIRKAKQACENSGYPVSAHFEHSVEWLVNAMGKKSKRTSINLSRYACYLIVQNANPSKPVAALAQTYFAIQSRKQELLEQKLNEEQSIEDQSRLLLRNEIVRHNKRLAEAARRAGVMKPDEFSAFQNQGYMGLYGGLDREQLHKKKGLEKNQKVLDYMGSTELAANLFRATQTEEKLRRENIHGKKLAYKVHYDVGQKVRQTIAELGGTMPEALPTPTKGINIIEQSKKANQQNSMK